MQPASYQPHACTKRNSYKVARFCRSFVELQLRNWEQQRIGGMSSNTKKAAPPRKDSILELAKMMDATVRVKCLGGRELQGTLRGYDELVNLVLDECDEFIRGW